MRASEFITERKKKKSSRSTGGYFFPGYGYYGSGESSEGGGDGGGESVDRGMAEGLDTETNYDGNLLVSLIQNYTPQSYAGDQVKQDLGDPDSLPFYLDDVVGLIDEIFYESLENGSEGSVLPDEKQDLRFFYRAVKKSQKQGMAEGLAQDEAEEEYGGWRAEFVNEINYNTFEVRVENVRARESANFIIRPVDMVSYGPTLSIETMDVHDLQTGQTESWTNDDPAPQGPIAFAISALFYDDKQLQKKLNNIIDTHNTKGQDMMPGLDQRRSIGQEVDSDSYIDSSEKTQAAMAKMKQGMAENFADGRNPQDKGDAKRHGINTKASVSSLRKTAKQGGRKGQLAHWLANMKSGRAKKK